MGAALTVETANPTVSMNRYIRSLLLSLVFLLPACASKPTATNNVSHRWTRSFDELGTVGVVVTNRLHNFAVITPMIRGEAWHNKALELKQEPSIPEQYAPVDPFGMLVPVELLHTTIVILNAATMSAFGVPKEHFLIAQNNIKQVCAELERGGPLCFNERLKNAVTEEWDRRGITPVVYLEPAITRAMQHSTLYPSIAFSSTLPPDKNPREYLLSRGVKSVLEVEIKDFGLKGKGKINPELAVEIKGNARLLSLDENRILVAGPFEYNGKRRSFTDWGSNSAALMRAEVDACYVDIARAVIASVLE